MNPELKPYVPIAKLIAKTFGSKCEAVIHDLSHPQNSVVYVINGHVTGRKVGQSFDHLVKQVLLNKNFSEDCTANYMFETEDGRKIKSSSALIRNSDEKVIGMLCVNCEVDYAYMLQDILKEFLPDTQENNYSAEEEVIEEVSKVIDHLIDKIIGDNEITGNKRKDNLPIIEFMDKKGVFLVKGAIDKVAERMGVSKVTIYSYLDEIHGKKKDNK